MRALSVAALAVFALAAGLAQAAEAHNTLTARERAQGWRLLFNGRNLDGWRSYRGGAPTPFLSAT